MGIMEQMVGSHLLCVVNVLVFKTVLHHSPHVFPLVSLRVSTVTDMVIVNDVLLYHVLPQQPLNNFFATIFQCFSAIL